MKAIHRCLAAVLTTVVFLIDLLYIDQDPEVLGTTSVKVITGFFDILSRVDMGNSVNFYKLAAQLAWCPRLRLLGSSYIDNDKFVVAFEYTHSCTIC